MSAAMLPVGELNLATAFSSALPTKWIYPKSCASAKAGKRVAAVAKKAAMSASGRINVRRLRVVVKPNFKSGQDQKNDKNNQLCVGRDMQLVTGSMLAVSTLSRCMVCSAIAEASPICTTHGIMCVVSFHTSFFLFSHEAHTRFMVRKSLSQGESRL
mmetsp:Transcript_11187/g.23560  ORF Transcript_11187/g.23560 Transcript_11187/m.23560 type:complete len:157 (-) Transcript_11187:1471-1941(-)